MGARLSARSAPRQEEVETNKPRCGPQDVESTRLEFQSHITRVLTKKSPSAGHVKLEIKGHIEKYPFWVSKSHLNMDSVDNKEIVYGVINADKTVTPCPPKLPNNLHCSLNKTMRLALKHKKSSISDLKQENYPEHDVILNCVTKLLFKISLNENGSNPSKLNFQLYEHHRNMKTGRRSELHLREMKVKTVLFDKQNNMAIIGNDFALIVNRTDVDHEHVEESSYQLAGVYIRTLDTCPSGVMTFNYHATSCVDDMKLPSSVTHPDEYVKRLLNKSSKSPFRIKLSRSKKVKS